MKALVYDGLVSAERVAQNVLAFTPDAQQQAVLAARSKRFLLNCTRQWGKSTTAAWKAAHRAVVQEDSLVILVSPTERQTGELFKKTGKALAAMGFPRKSDGAHSLSWVLPNGSRILGLPGTEATVRGYSAANLVIVDEAARVEDELYRSLRPMLAVSDGDLMLLSTPFGERGFFWREWTEGGADWTRMSVTAMDCGRISRRFLDEEWKALGEDWFRQEYLCSFVAMENQAVRRQWIETAKAEGLNYKKLVVEGWRV
jgi:hypothetical protein